MDRKILFAGLAGAFVLLLWTFILNVLFGFNTRFTMTPVPNEREVYSLLSRSITEPGRYLCSPALTPDGGFPEHEPVFGISYAGLGHEAAGTGELLGLAEILIAPLIGAWMLSRTSDQFRSRFSRRLGFFIALGLLLALTGDLQSFGIGGSPVSLALLLALRTLVTWTIIGAVVASLMGPVPSPSSPS